MTRFARGVNANKKKPHEGSTWLELSNNNQKSKPSGSEAEKSNNSDKEQLKNKVKVAKSAPESSSMKQASSDGQADQFRKVKRHGQFGDKRTRDKQFMKERQRERRRLRRKQDRDNKKVCYNCREPGHHLADCPVIQKDQEQGTGICFKCGSTEHSSASCRVKVPPGEYPFAKCFVCGEKGHISKQCPDNPRGLYPKGGCCKECGSVEHFRKDCPKLQKQQGIQDFTLETIRTGQSADSQVDTGVPDQLIIGKKKKKKVVNF